MRLSTRLTVAMVVLVLLTAAAVGLMINRSIEARALPRELDGIRTHAQLLAAELDGAVRGARFDVTIQGQDTRAFVDAILAGDHPGEGELRLQARGRLAARFVAELSAKPSYSHFRLIGLRNGGREILRVDRKGPDGAIRVVPDAELQHRANRDYFKATIRLPAGEVYASPLDFYEEVPRASTLRVAAPVLAADGSPFGILLVNVDMRSAFARLRETARRDAEVYVTNESGDYLVHPDAAKEFGFERGNRFRVQDEFPEFTDLLAAEDESPRIIRDRAGRRFGVGWAGVRLAGGPLIFVIESVPSARLVTTGTAVPSLLGAFVVVLCAFPLVVLLARSLSKPLVQMTNAIERFAHDGTMPVPAHAGGEIGVLAEAFERMGDDVRDTAAALTREVEDHRRTGERERLFNVAVEWSGDAIITSALDGTITSWNPGAERLFGFTSEEAVGNSIFIFVPDEQRDEVHALIAKVGAGEAVSHYETVRLRKDGRRIDVSLGVWPVRSPSGVVVGAAAIVRDISQGKRAAEALLDSARMARAIVDTALDAFVQMDGAGAVAIWNRQAEAIFGWSRDEVVGKALVDLIVPERHRDGHLKGLARFLKGGESAYLGQRIEIAAVRRDGSEINVELSVTALRQRDGIVFNAFIRDLTAKVAAEEQLRQSQKMEGVGQLTGGIAHDFNNMLTVITGTIHILAEAVADRPQLASVARLISDAADRGAELTSRLLAFARKQPLQPRDTDINGLLADLVKLLRPTLGAQVEIELKTEKDAWPALVDPTQLTTALLNLAVNARDAMPGGGKVTFETRNVVLGPPHAGADGDLPPGNYVMIAVSDSGVGMPEAIRVKVFEPFFSTKESGRGTGLGLSMVYGFVKQSGGHIHIDSEEGRGTTVRIYLPQASVAAAQPAAASLAAIEGGHEIILVVEDDPMVRSSVTTHLRSLGYRTVAAASGAEALAMVDDGAAFDLLFTDVVMPGPMNGRQLADAILERRPTVRVLYTSGYTQNAMVHHGRLDPGLLLLAKPYRTAELARMVRRALDAAPVSDLDERRARFKAQ